MVAGKNLLGRSRSFPPLGLIDFLDLDCYETEKVSAKEPKKGEMVLRRGNGSVSVKMVERGNW